MSEYLILIACAVCGYEEFFEIDNLPGGREHCPYCAECGALLPEPKTDPLESTPPPIPPPERAAVLVIKSAL